MMNLLYTNQENKEEEKQLSLSKSQLSQQSPPYKHTTNNQPRVRDIYNNLYYYYYKNHIENVSFFCVNYVLFYRATFSQKTE